MLYWGSYPKVPGFACNVIDTSDSLRYEYREIDTEDGQYAKAGVAFMVVIDKNLVTYPPHPFGDFVLAEVRSAYEDYKS